VIGLEDLLNMVCTEAHDGEIFCIDHASPEEVHKQLLVEEIRSMTHTYTVLEVSETTYSEIMKALKAAGYEDSFHEDETHGVVIDMSGLALALSQRETTMSSIRYGSMDHPVETIAEPLPTIGNSVTECPKCGSSALSTTGSQITGFETVCLGCRHSFRNVSRGFRSGNT
jgi:hypothetical protein